MKTKLPTIPCAHCKGTGHVLDTARITSELRLARKRARIGLRDMASRLRMSSGYLHDLEHGRRAWPLKLTALYRAALTECEP